MIVPIGLLCCTLTLGQAADRGDWSLAPQLAPGMEFVYRGTYAEESLIASVQHQRLYRLETLLFVTGGSAKQWDVAFLTTLAQKEAPQQQPVKNAGAASVRLELGSVETAGRLRGSGEVSLAVPSAGPPTLDTGMIIEVPPGRVSKGVTWEVNEDGRPPRAWKVIGMESVNGISCIRLEGWQQSEDWLKPRADSFAWRRHDTVWLVPQLGLPQKLERIIERRAPAHREPTQRLVVRYELESRLKYPGRLLDERRHEISQAKKLQDEARPLLQSPATYLQQIEALERRIDFHLEHQAATPYRQAIVHLKARLEGARRGESTVAADEEPLPRAAVVVGQRVADFVVMDLTNKDSTRLSRQQGRPVLVFFYSPTSESSKEVLRFVLDLQRRHGDKLGFMAMAITTNPDAARKQHADLRLPFPVLDGQRMQLTFGVDATPRFVVLDGESFVRAAHTGWGYHVPQEIAAELERCLQPSPPR